MKKLTYQGKLYTVEETEPLFVKFSGIGWRKKIECSHWIYGFMYKFFNVKYKGEIK